MNPYQGLKNDTFADLDCLTATNSIPVWDETTPPLWQTETESGSLVLAGVLLSLVVVYLASKLGGELSNWQAYRRY